MTISHLGKSNFRQPSDMDKAYIESLHISVIPELIDFAQLCLGKTFNAQTQREKAHALHIVGLIRIARARLEAEQPMTSLAVIIAKNKARRDVATLMEIREGMGKTIHSVRERIEGLVQAKKPKSEIEPHKTALSQAERNFCLVQCAIDEILSPQP